jgi:lipopolysaccharide/colanic/teichoic acid biosynthesis glycosyltransferase
MRVMFFSDNFRPECCPPASHVYERARLWATWGHTVTVVTTAPNFPEGKVYPGYKNNWRRVESMDGIRVVRVKTFIARNEGFILRVLDYMSFMVSGFLFAMLEKRPDVVISTSPQLFTPVAGVACAALRRVPHVFELRDLWPASILATGSMKPGRLYRMLEHLELFLYHRSARIVALTHSFKEDLIRRGIPGAKIDVVISGANLELFSPRLRDREIEQALGLEGRFVAGYLGTLGLAHGLHNIVDAAELLKDTPVTFLLVGAGADVERVTNLAEERGLTNIVFVPRQAKEDVPRYWSVCDAGLVHLRDADLFRTVIPSKVFECMAMGLPVVYVGPDGEGSEIVRSHGAGLMVNPEDPEALARAVTDLMQDDGLRKACVSNGLAAAPQYSRVKQAQGTLAALERAVEPLVLGPACCVRRAADIVAAFVGITLLSPIALLISALIKVGGPGSLLQREEGVGLHGRRFLLWRFRLPDYQHPHTRYRQITLFGRFLRKYKLDILPHLWNLLKGDVTLVGPRVRSPQEWAWMRSDHAALMKITPGLVGPATVRYRDLPELLEKVGIAPGPGLSVVLSDSARIALEYASRATLWTDIWVFSAGVLRVLFRGQFVAAVLRLLDPARIRSLVLTDQEQLQILKATALAHGDAVAGAGDR